MMINMKNINAFLLGLLISLGALPLYAACPPGMTGAQPDCYLGETLYSLPVGAYLEFDVNNDQYGNWLKANTTFDFSIPPGYDEIWYQYFGTGDYAADSFTLTAWTADYSAWEYLTPLLAIDSGDPANPYYGPPLASTFFDQYLTGSNPPTSSAELFTLPSAYISGGLATLAAVCILILGPKVFKWGGKQTVSMFDSGDKTYSDDYVAISRSALDNCDEKIAKFQSLP